MALYRVLVATDFTSSADRALARALRLPLDDGAELHLLHVVPARLPWQIGAAVRSGAWERLRTLAERAERRLAARQRHDVTVRPVLATGRPAEVIARRAAGKAELVVVGRHGQRGFPEALLGSTAVEVLRAVPAPVLVVSRAPTGPYRRPLATTDLTEASRAVFGILSRLMHRPRSVSVVHAWDLPYEGLVASAGIRSRELLRFRREAARHAVEGARRFLASLPATPAAYQATCRQGDPRTVILAAARRRKADLIAIGSHGRRGVARLLLGSVAEAVAREATADVLVARAPRR